MDDQDSDDFYIFLFYVLHYASCFHLIKLYDIVIYLFMTYIQGKYYFYGEYILTQLVSIMIKKGEKYSCS